MTAAIQKTVPSSPFAAVKETVNKVMTKIANCIAEIWNRIRGAITTLFGYTKAVPVKIHPLIVNVQNEINKCRTGETLTKEQKASIEKAREPLDKKLRETAYEWPRPGAFLSQYIATGLLDDVERIDLHQGQSCCFEKLEEIVPNTQTRFDELTKQIESCQNNPTRVNTARLKNSYDAYRKQTVEAKRHRESEWDGVIGAHKDKELRAKVEALLAKPAE